MVLVYELIREAIVLKLGARFTGEGEGKGEGKGECGVGSYIVEFDMPTYLGLYLSFLVAFP